MSSRVLMVVLGRPSVSRGLSKCWTPGWELPGAIGKLKVETEMRAVLAKVAGFVSSVVPLGKTTKQFEQTCFRVDKCWVS